MSNIKIIDTLERASYFQTVHAWPLNDKLDSKAWLDNFSDQEKVIASHMIDFFLYYPTCMVEQMLVASVGKAGTYLLNMFPDWNHNFFKTRCYYSFVPGETQNPTDSGYFFTRILREVLGVPENRIINFSEIHSILQSVNEPTAVILVDDFVGSGAQCDEAWNNHRYGGRTLKELQDETPHNFIYAPLIVNEKGLERIKNKCQSLTLTPAHVLSKEYNLFEEGCFCWKGDKDLYNAGVNLILEKSKLLGIQFTNGDSVKDVKGFGEQGLAIAFEHGVPDAIPPIFYWDDGGWNPLIKKRYQR